MQDTLKMPVLNPILLEPCEKMARRPNLLLQHDPINVAPHQLLLWLLFAKYCILENPISKAMNEISKTNLNLSCLQVIGCYGPGAHLYRWAETADGTLKHDQQDSNPQNYAATLMESTSYLSVLFYIKSCL